MTTTNQMAAWLVVESMRRNLSLTDLPDECWLWKGFTAPNGYGGVNAPMVKIPAHRLALIAEGVLVPHNMDVCHACDVRACVNPDHLYVGTRKQNMEDCSRRGRHNKPKGEVHWCAKLKACDVVELRDRWSAGVSQTELAHEFGVHPSTVSRIVRGLWRTEVTV